MLPLSLELKAAALLIAIAAAFFAFHRFVAGEQAKGAATCEAAHTEANLVAAQETQRLTVKEQNRRQEIEDEKNAQLRAVSARLADALGELRNRAPRADLSGAPRAACAGSTGAELAGPDAEFLERYAAIARELQVNLAACQQREHTDSLTPTQ